jgi:hypothetical protein
MGKLVTVAQVMEIKKMADEKGVDRQTFQALLDDGTFARVLDGQHIHNKFFPIWKTIKLGTGLHCAEDIQYALNRKNVYYDECANKMFFSSSFSVSDEEVDLDLIIVSVSELGLEDKSSRNDVIERALSLGLSLCPAEVGPQLRLQYLEQPRGEWLQVAMEPIYDACGLPSVFTIVHEDDECWLEGNTFRSNTYWSGDAQFVFALPSRK